MTSQHRVRSLAATALTGSAAVLRRVAKVAGGVAGVLQPSERDRDLDAGRRTQPEAVGGPADDDEPTAETPAITAADISESYAERGRVMEPDQVATGLTHAGVPPSHVAEIADGTVAEVRDAIGGLSTDELRLLHEHETSHKGRKGVLDAIEHALTT